MTSKMHWANQSKWQSTNWNTHALWIEFFLTSSTVWGVDGSDQQWYESVQCSERWGYNKVPKLPQNRQLSLSNHCKLELCTSKARLPYYLMLQDKSIALLKSCNVFQSCSSLLKELSHDILSLFGTWMLTWDLQRRGTRWLPLVGLKRYPKNSAMFSFPPKALHFKSWGRYVEGIKRMLYRR